MERRKSRQLLIASVLAPAVIALCVCGCADNSTGTGEGAADAAPEKHFIACDESMDSAGDGHWQVIAGIDTCGNNSPYDDVVIMADPYDVTDHYQDGYYTVPFGRFFDMWREGPCAQKADPYEQPYVIAVPE